MNRIVCFVAAALVAVFPLFASAQTLPGVTTGEPGVCGVAANTCKVGTLGDNAPQYSPFTGELVAYHWYCDGTNGGARSTLCFTAAVTPPPVADPFFGDWTVNLYSGSVRNGYNGSSTPLQFTSTAIVIDKITNSSIYSASYEGYMPAYPGSHVYLNRNGLQSTVPTAQLYLEFAETTFTQGLMHYVLNIQLNMPQDYGWGNSQGDASPDYDRGIRAVLISSEADLYRAANCCKGVRLNLGGGK